MDCVTNKSQQHEHNSDDIFFDLSQQWRPSQLLGMSTEGAACRWGRWWQAFVPLLLNLFSPSTDDINTTYQQSALVQSRALGRHFAALYSVPFCSTNSFFLYLSLISYHGFGYGYAWAPTITKQSGFMGVELFSLVWRNMPWSWFNHWSNC